MHVIMTKSISKNVTNFSNKMKLSQLDAKTTTLKEVQENYSGSRRTVQEINCLYKKIKDALSCMKIEE